MAFITQFTSGQNLENVTRLSETNRKLPSSLCVEYKANYGTFDNWLKLNRDHQMAAYDKALDETNGQISLPTGTGKTRVQIALHISKMIDMSKDQTPGVFVVGAHRLALCSQLLSEMIEVAVSAGIKFDILFVGSDRYDEDKVHCKFRKKGLTKHVTEATSTTRGDEIAKAVNKAHSRGRHVIAVSTYHSWERLNILAEITQATYDEAHTLVGDTFLDNIKVVLPKIKFNFYFTATRRVQGLDGGMNNTDVFGEILHEECPRKMIRKGEIVPPKLHIIQTTDEGDYDNSTMYINSVITGYTQHRHLVKTHVLENFTDVELGAKMLISTTGNKDMFELHNNANFQSYCERNNINVYAFSSQEGVYCNFSKVSRTQALDSMNAMSDEEDAIIMHIDILTEGIDVPSITGVMPFRELNTIKLLQTLGRGARLLKEDRRGIYGGEVAPMDYDSYIKPCVWLILPELFRSLGDGGVMKSTIRNIVNSYDVPVEEYNAIDRYLSDSDDDGDRITERDLPRRIDNVTGLSHIVEDVMDDQFNIRDVKEKLKDNVESIITAFSDVFK